MIKTKPQYTFLILLLFLFTVKPGQGQMIKEFHQTRDDYFLDITAVLEYSSNKQYLAKGQELLGSFATVWESGYFKPHHREKIYEVSNAMLKKSMRSYPHFYDFISIMVGFVEKGLDDNSLEIWLTELDTLGTQRSSKPMAEFLEYTLNLFDNNMLYQTRSRAWYFRNGEFKIMYDSLMYLYFEKLDLICSTGKDSMEIVGTSGKYFPSNFIWDGMSGRISWRRAGFSEDSVYADLGGYDVDLSKLSFSTDSAVLYNKMYFNFPIPGTLSEKIMSSPPRDRASYPRFESYFKDYEVPGIFENVNFEGGIGMEGRKVICSGDGDRPATYIFKKGGDYFAVIRSRKFEIEGESIISSPASFAIYFDKDSIYHPGLQMKYNNDTRMLSLIRLNRGIAQSPFFNSYHRVNMYSEALYWVMNSEEISFEMIRGISQTSKADFESDKYYSEYEYHKLQGIDEINPLVVIKNYLNRYKGRIVGVGALADFIGKPEEQAVSMLLLLDSKGFVVYDAEKRQALVKDRLFNYLDAFAGNVDYDVIYFKSETKQQSNALIELATFDMLISGVPELSISDSQQVRIYPLNEQIVMKQGKDFAFTGRIRAGLFEFYAQDCIFEYDTFRINMPQIDSMSFFIRVIDTTGSVPLSKLIRVQAVVEDMTGYILVDKPDNKSGLKTYPQYPVFNSTANSFVYYDDITDLNGAFNRDEYYYELDPFTLDSLDNFSTTGLHFEGYLATGGILPPLEDELVVMPDYSLGVKSITDEEGLEIYNGKARFYDTISIDNSGLHGAGRYDYLTASTNASDIEFYPDSVTSTTNSFSIDKMLGDVEYADVKVGKAMQKWYPDSNLMVIEMMDEPIEMYDSTSLFRGALSLRPDGLYGTGEFSFERALIKSDNFVYGHHRMYADTSDFRLYTDTSFAELAFLMDGYSTALDFDQRNGKFISTGLSSDIDIPFNKFKCYMDEIDWDMDGQSMRLRNNIAEQIPNINEMSMTELIDLNLEGSEFISTHPEKDSLRFFSTRAEYDLQNNILYAEDVKIIRVADAAIFPGDGKLNILKDAEIETLRYAHIIADTSSKYHHIYNANVNIFSRHQYVASGDVDYKDLTGESTPIYLSSIGVDSLGRSYGYGRLSDTADFKLSPWYSFVGNVKLSSWEQYLNFDGYYSLIHDCFAAFNNRPLIDTMIDPENIIIPVPDSLWSAGDQHILTSLAFSPSNEKFYPAFFSSRKREDDFEVLKISGFLTHDPDEEAFRITESSGLNPRPYLSLHTDNCVLEGIGIINPGVDLPYVGLDLFGQASHFIIPDSTTFNLVMGYDFFFDDNILKRFARSLSETNLPGSETDDIKFMTFLKQRIPELEANRVISELSTVGSIRKMPDEIKYTLLFSQLHFTWNPSTYSYVSHGDIGLFSVGDEVVNRLVPGYVEIERKGTGMGVVNVYIEIPDGDWYFFSYRNYIMQAISSNEGFNNEILNLGEDKRIIELKDEESPYEFVISSRRKMVDFKRKMEEIQRTH